MLRRATLVAAAACAVLALAPAGASADAKVQVVGSQINVFDNFPEAQIADNIEVYEDTPGVTQISNLPENPESNTPLELLEALDPAGVSCVQDQPFWQVTCTRTAPVILDIYSNFGDDRVLIGPHGSDLTGQVRAHGGDDWIDVSNGSADRLSCGAGNDTAITDAFDTIFTIGLADDGCESQSNGSGGGGGGGGGGGCVGNDCLPGGGGNPPPAGPQDPTPYKVFYVTPVKLKTALKKGLKLMTSCSPAGGKVKADLKLKKRVVSKVSGTCKPATKALTFKFTKKDRNRFFKLGKLKLKLTVRVDGRVVSLLEVKLSNKLPQGCTAAVAEASC